MVASPHSPHSLSPTSSGHPGLVMVVDDDQTSRFILKVALQKQGYQVHTAEDVAEAQKQLRSVGLGAYDCVVSDYCLPPTSGLELLSWIQGQDPGLATIIVTAIGEKNLVTDSLRGGAIDFLDKPVDMIKLRQAVERAVKLTRRQRHLIEAQSAVEVLGRTQQRMLGTHASCSSVTVEICFHPKLEAGGDFFSRFQPTADQYFGLLTDVSGHDLQAAYISAFFHGYVRGKLESGAGLEKILADFNQFLLEEMDQKDACGRSTAGLITSVVVCAFSLDLHQNKVTVLNHGAPTPIYVAPDGQAHWVGSQRDFPLGWFTEGAAQPVIQPIAVGGSFLVWTDGLEDLSERNGVSALSLAFTLQQAQNRRQRVVQLDSARDDILLARIHLSPNSADSAFFPLLLEQYYGSQISEIDEIQSYWQQSLDLAMPELPASKVHDILLASREALINALVHGCGQRSDEKAVFQLTYSYRTQVIRVRVKDFGPGHHFNLAQHEALAMDQLVEEHRGLMLMKHLANVMILEHGGSQVILDFSLLPEQQIYDRSKVLP